MCDICMVGQTVEPLSLAPEFIPTVYTDFFFSQFLLDGYLCQPRYSREALGPSLKQCRNTLSEEWIGVGWGEGGGNGRRGGSKN